MKDRKLMKGTLHSLLLAINGLEGEELPSIANAVRAALHELVRDIGFSDPRESTMRSFDSVFEKAGWDNQGIRLCRDKLEHEKGRLVLTPRIVQFTDGNKSAWEPA